VNEKITALHHIISMYELRWYEKALDQLFECRRALAYSYVFAYYMFGDEMNYHNVAGNKAHKVLFEDHQEQLEICTERLNKMIIMPVEEVKPSVLQDLMNLTGIADRRTKALFDIIIHDILATADYGFHISRYHPNIEGNRGRTAAEMRSVYDLKQPPVPSAKSKPPEKKPKKEEPKQAEKGFLSALLPFNFGVPNPVAKPAAPKVQPQANVRQPQVVPAKKPAAVAVPAKPAAKPEPVVVPAPKQVPVAVLKPNANPPAVAKPPAAGAKPPPAGAKPNAQMSEEEMLRLAIEASLKEAAPAPAQPNPNDEEDDLKKALELSLKEYQTKMGV
jgi:hypothetical protein